MARRAALRTYTSASPPLAQALITANGNYLLKTPSGPGGTTLLDWAGGQGSLQVAGSFDSGTVQLQILGTDGLTWLNLGSPVTVNAIVNFSAPAGPLRLAVTGIITASSLMAGVIGIPANNGG